LDICLLTIITLISLFVWHFTGTALAGLMCARCAAAVGYSILMRVMHHSASSAAVAQVAAMVSPSTLSPKEIEARIAAQIEDVVNQFNARLEGVQSETSQVVHEAIRLQIAEQLPLVHAQIAELVQASQESILEQVNHLVHPTVSKEAPARARPRMMLVQKKPATKGKNEPAGVRVPRFIQEQVNQGKKPSLTEIMEQCRCSRNTAIRYRRELMSVEGL
jgi:hypothetical protein